MHLDKHNKMVHINVQNYFISILELLIHKAHYHGYCAKNLCQKNLSKKTPSLKFFVLFQSLKTSYGPILDILHKKNVLTYLKRHFK